MPAFQRVSVTRTIAVLTATILLLSFGILCMGSQTPQAAAGQLRLTGAENHDISLAEAAVLTRNYRENASVGTVTAEAFGKNAIQDILSQEGCTGLRIYYGKKTDGAQVLVLVGVNALGADLTNGKIAETGFPCPPWCDLTSPLAH